MSDIAIKVENLSKSYQVKNGQKGGYTALRDVISNKVAGVWGNIKSLKNLLGSNDSEERFWALKDLSFEVKKGEVLGIIGRNGAGKSTLLKILSRITEPDAGRVTMNGRVSSLLEVGTGFHPELTGRENIYLSGAILGMKRHEIKKRFDEIVDFSGVEKFIDTPVKRYSSGMYVRLGFSVAAHLETEILLVDEVLAVGDLEFQKKCINKIQDYSRSNKTILLVSHNIHYLSRICERIVYLQKGRLINDGTNQDVIRHYQKNTSTSFLIKEKIIERGNDKAMDFYISNVSLKNQEGHNCYSFTMEDSIILSVEYYVKIKLRDSIVNLEILDHLEKKVISFDTDLCPELLKARDKGKYESSVMIPANRFRPGRYKVNVGTGIINKRKIHHVENCIEFSVQTTFHEELYSSFSSRRNASMAMVLEWVSKKLSK